MQRAVLLLLSGLVLTANAALPVRAQTSPPARTASVDPHAGYVAEASQRFGIPEACGLTRLGDPGSMLVHGWL